MVWLLAAVLVLVGAVPAAAQPESSAPTSWGAFAGGLVDWAQGVWSILAGSESSAPPAEGVDPTTNPDGSVLDDSGENSLETDGEVFPALDPVG